MSSGVVTSSDYCGIASDAGVAVLLFGNNGKEWASKEEPAEKLVWETGKI